MDHRITIAIVGVFGAVLGFTFLTASLTTTVGPESVEAVFGATPGGSAADEPVGPSPRELLAEVLHLLDRQAGQWRLDHGGREPDFVTYPDWQQFLHATDARGTPANGAAAGAYFSRPPVNPLNGLGTVVVVDGPLHVAVRVPSPPERAGFVYSTVDRCFWGTNGTARVIITRGSAPPAAPPQPVTPAPFTAPANP
jgi:hypothetical protein